MDKVKFVHLGNLQPLAFFIAEIVLGYRFLILIREVLSSRVKRDYY